MKEFLKYTLATITGLVLVCVVISLLSLLALAGMASMDSATAPIADNSVLVIKLDGSLTERATENPFAELFGNDAAETGLDDLLAAIKNAKDNDKIKGIYLEAGSMGGATPAMLQELHDALADFKTSDKFILSYGDNYSQGAYYLCSVADSIVINPEGIVELTGVASQIIYYKNLLDKLGVKMQVFKVGTYKSAVEPYILDDMSDANREQMTTFLGEIWDEYLADMSKSRKIKVETLNEMIDSAMIFKGTDYYLENKIVDKVAYSDEVPNIIAAMMGCDKNDYKTAQVKDAAAAQNSKPKSIKGEEIAVYYAYGEIVQEPSSSLMQTAQQIVGEKVVKDLKELADNEDVKAVVFRVNSPGGSAFASEQIWNQVMNIKSKKPIIVSMGGYAASGGYYISCAADWIVAEPTTLTGSIGIFGMFPEASELLNDKIGLKSCVVQTNTVGDFGNYFRPMTDVESASLQAYINRGYELFTKRCADGRGIAQDSIKVIGEGRVWTGVHAKSIGLVDQLGNLEDAIEVAKKKAELEDCTIKCYPAKPNFFEELMDQTKGGDSYADAQLKEVLGDYYDIYRSVKEVRTKDNIQAALPYFIKFNL